MEAQGQSLEDNVKDTGEPSPDADNANRKRRQGKSGSSPASGRMFICAKANTSSSVWK